MGRSCSVAWKAVVRWMLSAVGFLDLRRLEDVLLVPLELVRCEDFEVVDFLWELDAEDFFVVLLEGDLEDF
jgi:hypothetical protein